MRPNGGDVQIKMPLRGIQPLPHHKWDPVARAWTLTPEGWQWVLTGKEIRVRWSSDAACWYDKLTGEIHSPFRRPK